MSYSLEPTDNVVVTRPAKAPRKHTLSELIDLDSLPSDGLVESPSGELLSREQFLQRPDRPASIRERQERIRKNILARQAHTDLHKVAVVDDITPTPEQVHNTKVRRFFRCCFQ